MVRAAFEGAFSGHPRNNPPTYGSTPGPQRDTRLLSWPMREVKDDGGLVLTQSLSQPSVAQCGHGHEPPPLSHLLGPPGTSVGTGSTWNEGSGQGPHVPLGRADPPRPCPLHPQDHHHLLLNVTDPQRHLTDVPPASPGTGRLTATDHGSAGCPHPPPPVPSPACFHRPRGLCSKHTAPTLLPRPT